MAQNPGPKARTPEARRRSTSKQKQRGRPAGLFTWIGIGLVTIVVATLVIIRFTQGNEGPTTPSTFQSASSTVTHELANVPARVFNEVGVTAPTTTVTPPLQVRGQPNLATVVDGESLPDIFYIGGEFCPFCAAQRWSTIIALSRFGTFSGLGDMTSFSSDTYPNTPTFTFVKSKYVSRYVAFTPVEEYANYLNKAKTYYATLQKPTTWELADVKRYDTSTFIEGISANENPIPFMSFANKFLVSGSSYNPETLRGMSRNQIAGALTNVSDPVTQVIVASANYQTAAICVLTNGKPGNVCTSHGVKAAATAMGLK